MSKPSFLHPLRAAALLVLGVCVGFLTSLQFQAHARNSLGQLPLEELQQFAAVYSMILSDYVEPVKERELMENAISGMVSSLDPHSQYLDRKSFQEFKEGASGKFVGVGIEITMEDSFVKVVSPIEDSPAYRAGIKSGDLITRIDDTLVRGLTINEAVKRMRGEEGTKVTLTVWRRSENRTFPLTITREQIRTRSVRSDLVEPGYGWIRVSQFQERTVEDFARKLVDLYRQEPGLRGLVLDLRNDPGGLLDAAIGISSIFLAPGAPVVSTDGQLSSSKSKMAALNYSDLGSLPKLPGSVKRLPLVVLVNEGSASASEIVAGALKDNHRATIMGARSFGKGSVQTVRQISADTGLKLTTARYYTPSGQSIQAKGITPDIPLDETEDGADFSALRIREADLNKHLAGMGNAMAGMSRDADMEHKREEARKRLEAELAKKSTEQLRLPEFGSKGDFQLRQALNQLKGLPVAASKAKPENPEAASQR